MSEGRGGADSVGFFDAWDARGSRGPLEKSKESKTLDLIVFNSEDPGTTQIVEGREGMEKACWRRG